MRDEHDGACVAREEILEPRDGVDVEMIARLVQEQQVRLAHEGARQENAPPPAARQGVHDRIAREIQPRHDQIGVMLANPAFVLRVVACVAVGDDVEDRSGRRRVAHPVPGVRLATPGARHTAPASGWTSLLRIFSSVDLPAPFRPSTAMRSPRSICIETLSRSGRCPYAIEMRSRVRSGTGPHGTMF